MNQKAVRSKLVYFLWLLTFAGVCMISGFLLYIQTVQVSLTSSLRITMEGSNGNAHITEIKNPDVENSGQSGFFASVVYQAYPSGNLSNGQQITITALSSVDFGRQFRISANSKSVQVTIEGLTDEDKTTEMEVKQ
ncbi:MAG: hypothetical protein HUJ54_12910 [Erysipelotrichaceae bacterium]|nr:hypothetical protein [Erysipelotrichaceae bacterium]